MQAIGMGTVVDLADFISRVSTAKTGDHIIAGVAAEEPPELGGLLVPDGISATLIALPSMKTSHPSQELSALTLQRCCESSESGDVAGFPSMEADCCFVSGYCC